MFAKLEKRPDFSLVGQIVNNLRFFKVFDHTIRMKLLFISDYKVCGPGELIISPEEMDESIVVLISGLLNVIVKDDFLEGDYLRQTLYPGDSIGENEVSIFKTRPKQRVYIKSYGTSDVLFLKKRDLPDILQPEIE